MSNLVYNISQVLGISILHSLWQGLLILLLLRMIIAGAPGLSSAKKYNMAVVTMLGVAVWFFVTLVNEASNFNWSVARQAAGNALPANGLVNRLSPFTAPADRYYYVISGYLPYISAVYLFGFLVNLFKMGYWQARLYTVRKTLLPANDMQWLAEEFAERLGITRYVKVCFSALIDVPCMMGHLKPVILLPISLVANLSVAETEAILLHELAHIKRNDYLVNLLQQIVNSLLFFNPFAQIISRLISRERENCCDDLVVQTTNNPLVYARALLKLEETRQTNLQLALAATNKKNYLLTRIERIMKTKQNLGNIRHLVLAILLLAGSLSSIAWLNPEIKNGKVTVKHIKPAEVVSSINTFFEADTLPKKASKKGKRKVTFRSKDSNGNEVYFNGFSDAQLDKLSADVERQGEAMSKYYDSPEFKAKTEEMERLGKQMEQYYNSDRMKALTAEQEKLGKEFEKKYSNNGEMEKYGREMEGLGKKMEKYFSSPEFKKMDSELKKKYGITGNYGDSRDPNYKKYQDELHSKLSPEIKETTEQMKNMGAKMRGFYQSPEFAAQSDRLRAMGDSLRKAFNSPAMKEQQERMRKLGQEMRSKFNGPEMAKQRKAMQEATAKMRAYTNSPEFKKKMAEFRKNNKNFNYNFNYDVSNGDSVERAEKPEQPEKAEKPEPAEKP